MKNKTDFKNLVIEELKKALKEESEFSKNYIPIQVKDFIAKSDTNSPYKPQIKLHWGGDNGEANTKWISVPWEYISSIIDYFQKNAVKEFKINEDVKLNADFKVALQNNFVNSFVANKLWTIMEYTEKIPKINKSKIRNIYMKFITEIVNEINNTTGK